LTLERETKVKSVYGAILSVVLILTVLVYAVNGGIQVYLDKVESISTLEVY
jgi:hypothetical protein